MQHNNVKTLKGIPLSEARRQPEFAPLDLGIADGNRSKPPRFPLEVFGGWSDWITKSAEKCSAPRDYVTLGLLATVSTLLGNARWVSPWDGWQEPPVLWLAGVGDPSSGKSPALDSALRFLRQFESEMAGDFSETLREFERDREVSKAIKEGWQGDVKHAAKEGLTAPIMPEGATEPEPPLRPRLYVSDATQEAMGQLISAHPKGLLHLRDELAGWLLNFDRYGGGGEKDFWLEGYGGRSYVIDRVKHNKEPIRIEHLSLGVIGGIQPERLADILMKGTDGGFAARFLMVWPDRVPPNRPNSQPINSIYQDKIRRLQHLKMAVDELEIPIPTIKFLSESAADLFQEWRQLNASTEKEAFGLMLSHLGKLPGIVLRLSITLEYLNWCLSDDPEPETISETSLEHAVQLVDTYFKPMAVRVYGDAALPTNEKNAAILARRILAEKTSVVNANHVRRYWKLPGLRKTEPVLAALSVLVEAGWLCLEEQPAGRGRPKLDYTVNPKLLGGI